MLLRLLLPTATSTGSCHLATAPPTRVEGLRKEGRKKGERRKGMMEREHAKEHELSSSTNCLAPKSPPRAIEGRCR